MPFTVKVAILSLARLSVEASSAAPTDSVFGADEEPHDNKGTGHANNTKRVMWSSFFIRIKLSKIIFAKIC
jgi:hypothetical protein